MNEAIDVIDEWNGIEAPEAPEIRSVALDPARTALLLLDFERKVCTPDFRPRAAAALPRLRAFLQTARAHDVAVVHTVTSQGLGHLDEFTDALRPHEGERTYCARIDKFHGNDLEHYLRGRGVDTVIVTGTSPNGCVLFTTAGALLRGFRPIVPIDAMPAKTLYQEQFVAWQMANGGGGFITSTVLTSLSLIRFGESAGGSWSAGS
jgi:nicotinamidase-related amidase